MKLKFIHQYDQSDCGPACLTMLVNYYGKKCTLQSIREKCFVTKEGVSIAGINHAAKLIGLDAKVYRLSRIELEQLSKRGFCILHWNQNHFVVLLKIIQKRGRRTYKIADPGYGIMTLNENEILKHWISNKSHGVAITFEKTSNFYDPNYDFKNDTTFNYIRKKIKSYKWKIFTLFITIFITSCCTLIFPFITQAVVDKGINTKDISFVAILLFIHASIYLGSTAIDIMRNWITLYFGTKLSIGILTDFLTKILRLPLSFFESKQKGDFNQRIFDQQRIETFLTTQSIITIFSILNFFIFFGILFYYSTSIILAYFSLTVLAVMWSLLYIKTLKSLDYNKFQLRSENQDSIYEFVNGIEEIKLNNLEDYKCNLWRKIQLKLFDLNIRTLKTTQFQLVGFDMINQLKNILITYLSAREVINGNITLGTMLSIAFIIGLMNAPISNLVTFIKSYQEAKLSLERLNEVQNITEEGEFREIKNNNISIYSNDDIVIKDLTYQYGSPSSKVILNNISVTIPKKKITAIVGGSGSGKTTFLKLLLKLYQPTEGKIKIGEINLNSIAPNVWRDKCGVVLQEGYIFSDTIEQNIACGVKNINNEKLQYAVQSANIESFIKDLPLGFKTKIGTTGNNLSTGQKQRILIARAIYKDPLFLFFDEATSALDTENEKIIHDNLQSFFKNKTVIIIAHRLSTVKNADQIVVLKEGQIVEIGTHKKLVQRKKEYYNLVKNQLELST